MKKKKLLCILATLMLTVQFSALCGCGSSESTPSQESVETTQTSVSSEETSEEISSETESTVLLEEEPEPEPEVEEEVTYVLAKRIRHDGGDGSTESHEYDTDGDSVNETYDPDVSQVITYTYEYDESGWGWYTKRSYSHNVIEKTSTLDAAEIFDEQGLSLYYVTESGTIERVYNQDGNMISDHFMVDDLIQYYDYYTYEFDASNRVAKQTIKYTDKYDSFYSECTFQYDEEGREIENAWTDGDYIVQTFTKYDENGNACREEVFHNGEFRYYDELVYVAK